ncbi:hypothetical protein [Rhodococcus sp. NPDC004095]
MLPRRHLLAAGDAVAVPDFTTEGEITPTDDAACDRGTRGLGVDSDEASISVGQGLTSPRQVN